MLIELLKGGYKPYNIDRKSESSEVLKYFREWNKLSLSSSILYRSTVLNDVETKQIVIPVLFHSIVLQHLHDDVGHQGRDRTLSLVRARFYWSELELDVVNKVRNCEKCIKRKTIPAPSAELVNIISLQPMELVRKNFLSLERSKEGFENILVITDHFTRYAKAFPTRIKTPRPLQRSFLTISLFIMASLLAYIVTREEILKAMSLKIFVVWLV